MTNSNDSECPAAGPTDDKIPGKSIPARGWGPWSDACAQWLGGSAIRGLSLPAAATNSLELIHPLSFGALRVVPTIATAGFGLLLLVAGLLIARLMRLRRRARSQLRRCGLPVVYWRPKNLFTGGSWKTASSSDTATSTLLRSTNITNILPRMKRLQGPYEMYGTVYGVSTPVIHVAHPVPAAAILSSAVGATPSSTRPSNLSGKRRPSRGSGIATCSGATKSPAYDHFKNFCGDGVFTADGDDWRQKRAAVLHVLLRSGTANIGSPTAATFETNVERGAHDAATKLIARLERSIDASSHRNLHKVNVVPLLQRTTLGLIYRYLTHQELPGDANPMDEYGSTNPAAQPYVKIPTNDRNRYPRALLSRYLDSITQIRMIVLAQSRSVWFLLPRWCYRTFSGMYRDEEQTMGPIRAFSERACREALPGSPLHLLSRHFAPYCQPDIAPVQAKSSTLDDNIIPIPKSLLDEAITLLFAGQDTSAATLSWTLHLLSLYPAIQNNLAAEIATVLPPHDDVTDDSSSGTVPLSRKVLKRLPYLDAVVKESMRLYPVAPFVVRRLPCDVAVHSNGDGQPAPPLTLPKDSFACIWIYALHRNEQFWDCPNEFRPERWLVDSGQQRDPGITNGAYMPFAIGPRNCVGQPMAAIILRSLLARLIHRFTFDDPRLIGPESTLQTADAMRKDMQAGFTVLPLGGVELCITRRPQACSCDIERSR